MPLWLGSIDDNKAVIGAAERKSHLLTSLVQKKLLGCVKVDVGGAVVIRVSQDESLISCFSIELLL